MQKKPDQNCLFRRRRQDFLHPDILQLFSGAHTVIKEFIAILGMLDALCDWAIEHMKIPMIDDDEIVVCGTKKKK
jgi:hypothetical protein